MERNAAQGYAALSKETTKGVPASIPSIYTPYYDQNLITDPNLISDEPIFGNLFKRFQSLPGIRSHGGSLTVMAEPNTAARWFDMTCAKLSTAGANPYTHTFGASGTIAPSSYTLDLSFVTQVVRFAGVESSKTTIGWDGEKMVLKPDLAALKSFFAAEVASVTGSGPYTVTLKTRESNSKPTELLLAGDLMQIYDISANAFITFAVTAVTGDTTITTATNVTAAVNGDILVLRPASAPSPSVLTPFLAGNTQWRFAADAATALTAAQSSVELGSELSIMYEFENNKGAQRYGNFDPTSLPRTVYDAAASIKRYFDTPQDIITWNTRNKTALVMRAFAGSTNQYELRVTLNDLRFQKLSIPTSSAKNIYKEIDLLPNYDQSDGKGFELAVINAISTI